MQSPNQKCIDECVKCSINNTINRGLRTNLFVVFLLE
ncbi:hypothetical protein SDC9_118128 [bioreactor metagenome]|uniref:Uncharacterized protein n=1 Tax=bioreactor metagenome TaxID=1076179 RepID=A0A645C0U5_9ZZZZ